MQEHSQRFERLRDKAVRAMLSADLKALETVTNEAMLAGLGPLAVELQVLAPALQRVGTMWHEGSINVAQEHAATQLTISQMERLRRELEPQQRLNKRCVVTAVEGEVHFLGARLVADILYFDGWDVDFLGADTPTLDLVEFTQQREADLVVLSITLEDNVPRAVQAIKALKAVESPPKIMVGGRALGAEPIRQRFAGADSVVLDTAEVAPAARKVLGVSEDHSLEMYLKRIGGRIQARRKELGWNQSVLAQHAGLDRTYISSLERGKQNLSLAALLKLAEALNTTIDYLVAGDGRALGAAGSDGA